MRRIGTEEATTVGAQVLDGFESGDRADDDGLVAPCDVVGNDLCVQRLGRALPYHEEGQHETHRQQNAGGEAHQVTIEIAEVDASVLDDERADERHRDNETGRGRCEHRKGDRRHLTDSVVSPLYACQSVFVMKLIAVLKARTGSIPLRFRGFRGSRSWNTRTR